MGRRTLAVLTLLSALAGCRPPHGRYGHADLTVGEPPRSSRVFVGRRVVLLCDGLGLSPLYAENERLLATLQVFPPSATLSSATARVHTRGQLAAAEVRLASGPKEETLLIVTSPEVPPPADQLDLGLRLCVAQDCEDLAVVLAPVPRERFLPAWGERGR